MSQDVFQKQLDTAFKGLDGVTGFVDGTFVYGLSEAEHDRNLTKLIEGAQQKGVVFNKEKCSSSVRKSASSNTPGRHKESNLTTRNHQLLLDMKPPKDVKSLQSFLGLVNYLTRYSGRLATLPAPLKDLTKKDNAYSSGPEQD